jgi:hypothetical protein
MLSQYETLEKKWANQVACSGVRVTNTCTPLCIYMTVYNLTLTPFQSKDTTW